MIRKLSFIICLSLVIVSCFGQVTTPIPSAAPTVVADDSISLELKNIDVVEVIKILSRKGKFNVVIGPNVKGRVTMFLNNVSIKDAMMIVLESANLAILEKKGIFEILPTKEFEVRYGRPFYEEKQLVTFSLKNALASDVAQSLAKLKPQSVIVVDERTNSLLIKETPEGVADIQKAIDGLDRPIVNQTYSFKYISPKEVEELVKMLLSKKGKYHINPGIRSVIVSDFPVNVENIFSILEKHDLPSQLKQKTYELDYAKFDAIEAKLKDILTPEVGKVITDERTNKVIVTDLASQFDLIDRVIAETDTKDRQVLIEAKIVQVILNDKFKFGINWQTVIEELNSTHLGLKLMNAYGNTGDLTSETTFAQSINALSQVAGFAQDPINTENVTDTTTVEENDSGTTTTRTQTTTKENSSTSERLESELNNFNQVIPYPTEGGGRIIATGRIHGHQFEGVLDALKQVGKAKVLSSPRIITLNNEEAKIQVASREAYVTSTTVTPGSGPSTTSENVSFIDVGITLAVTPTINKEDFITLKVQPEISSVTNSITTSSGNRIPIVSKQEVESKVQVKNGITVVLGGIHEQVQDKNESKIPLLGDIPILGYLFTKIDNSIRNSELVMFLTPRIMTGEKNFFEEEDALISPQMEKFLAEKEVFERAREYELSKGVEEE